MKKSIILFTVFHFLVIPLYSQIINPHQLDPYNPEYAEGEVLVKFKDHVDLSRLKSTEPFKSGYASLDSLFGTIGVDHFEKVFRNAEKKTHTRKLKSWNGDVIEEPQLFNIYRMRISSSVEVINAVELLSGDPNVDYAEPNYYFYTMETYPDDPMYQGGEQWYIDAVNATAAWDSTTSDTSQIIGIIDTGVDWDHPDLDNNIWRNWNEIPDNGIDDDGNGFVDDIRGWDFINNDNDPNDDNSHGTHVAGIAAAESNNGIGISGIAWNAKIMSIKVLQSSGYGSSSDLAKAINYAADNKATVINMSLGSYGESLTVKAALENAYAYAVLVAAAGNNGYKVDPPYPPWPIYAPLYPACYSFVIGVIATDQTNELTSFSNFDPSGPVVAGNNFGHNYEIKAPGVNVFSTSPNGNYRHLSGTSMASPIVAGAVALMKSYNPSQSTEQLFARLIQGANNGILDIRNSLDYELEPDLHFVEFTMVDTLPSCDNDGIVDAGETIEIYLTVKNAGGFADSVWSKLRIWEFEDTTTSDIIDSTSFIGDISAYATLTGELNPFKIEIDPDVVNNRDIVFEYEIGNRKSDQIINGKIIVKVSNGEELLGIMDSTMILTPDKLWIVTGSFKVGSNGVLILKPGVNLVLNNQIANNGTIEAFGKKDSAIVISGQNTIIGGNLNFFYVNYNSITTSTLIQSNGTFHNCIFKDLNLGYAIAFDCSISFIDHRFSCT